MTKFWRRPMFKWRCILTLFVAVYLLASNHLFGFRSMPEPQDTIFLFTIVVVWCICDATVAVLAALRPPQ